MAYIQMSIKIVDIILIVVYINVAIDLDLQFVSEPSYFVTKSVVCIRP